MSRPKKGDVTITMAARVLRVSRVHLSRCINGVCKNPRLLEDYLLFVERNSTTQTMNKNEKSYPKN